MQQLAVATVFGRDWIGAHPRKEPVMGVFCEDDESELHRRFVGIASHYDVPLSALTDLHVKSLAGEDAIMAAPSRGGIIEPTPLFSKLEAEAKKVRPRIIVLDNSADLYAGDENNRTQVRQFIGLLRRLAMQSGAAIVLSSHPSLTGESSGSGLSGSTAWNASVRARLYLRRQPRAKKDEPQPAPNARTLEVMKNNYGATGEKIELRWQDGLFLPSDDTVSLSEKLEAERNEEEVFLRLLAAFDRQGRNVSATKTAPNYAL